MEQIFYFFLIAGFIVFFLYFYFQVEKRENANNWLLNGIISAIVSIAAVFFSFIVEAVFLTQLLLIVCALIFAASIWLIYKGIYFNKKKKLYFTDTIKWKSSYHISNRFDYNLGSMGKILSLKFVKLETGEYAWYIKHTISCNVYEKFYLLNEDGWEDVEDRKYTEIPIGAEIETLNCILKYEIKDKIKSLKLLGFTV